jgi:hypothetical protein
MSEACSIQSTDVPGVGPHFVGVLGELDAAGLAAATHLHLRLDHDRIADAVGGTDGSVDRLDSLPRGDGNPVAREQLRALVLEQVQRRSS